MTDLSKRASDRLILAQKELVTLMGAALTLGLNGVVDPLQRIKALVEDARRDLTREEQA